MSTWMMLSLERDRVILKNITPDHNSEATYQTTKYKCYRYKAILETIKFLQIKLVVRNITTRLCKRNKLTHVR